ncbi:MAG: hypothetical protein EOP84_11135, partial [Verrucomicrobiaceae bacterium]
MKRREPIGGGLNPWTKGVRTRGGIDAETIWESSAEGAKAWVQETHAESPEHFSQIVGLIAKLAHGISCSTLGRLVDLERRLAQAETQKFIDAEVFDEVAALAKLVENMQSEFVERSVNYRGYWRKGMQAKRGDMFTDHGSTWIAVRATDEAPSTHCSDWCVAA